MVSLFYGLIVGFTIYETNQPSNNLAIKPSYTFFYSKRIHNVNHPGNIRFIMTKRTW